MVVIQTHANTFVEWRASISLNFIEKNHCIYLYNQIHKVVVIQTHANTFVKLRGPLYLSISLKRIIVYICKENKSAKWFIPVKILYRWRFPKACSACVTKTAHRRCALYSAAANRYRYRSINELKRAVLILQWCNQSHAKYFCWVERVSRWFRRMYVRAVGTYWYPTHFPFSM